MSNSPYCLPYGSGDVSFENLALDQLIPELIFFFILITCLFDSVLILSGEFLSWSLMGVKGLTHNFLRLTSPSQSRHKKSEWDLPPDLKLSITKSTRGDNWHWPFDLSSPLHYEPRVSWSILIFVLRKILISLRIIIWWRNRYNC